MMTILCCCGNEMDNEGLNMEGQLRSDEPTQTETTAPATATSVVAADDTITAQQLDYLLLSTSSPYFYMNDFVLMFGEQYIRETPRSCYAVLKFNEQQNVFVFFNEAQAISTVEFMGAFKSDVEFLDFILGDNVSWSEVCSFDTNSIGLPSGAAPIAAFYTKEGVFILAFFQKASNGSYGHDYYLSSVQYYSNEELMKSNQEDVFIVPCILAEDKR